ncbi:MAG: NADH-quinone oxidoreductase subunit L, partial [Planctomycetes bacterium]|nr:NADH-quinone oxidoreductase subunit L [Planctomycetota bacterium]
MESHSYEILLALGVLSPFVSFWILVFFGPRLGKPAAGWVAVVLGMGIPLVLATYVLIGWLGEVQAGTAAELSANVARFEWARIGSVPVILAVKLDSLTVVMYFMVTFIAFWIFVFSIGYMSGHSDEVAGQSKYHRFFAYLSLFAFSMLGLVISSSLLFLFVFWELVGLCSYLLIGFYFDRAYASAAAIKAFVTNRVGDFGFLIGLMLVYYQLGTLDLDEAATAFASQYATGSGIFASQFTLFGWSLATIMGIGLFCGAMGKSAQFPLHVWLPDAMAGPTPVSALIHAATMVAAGVYLVARVFRLMTPDALMFLAAIGCLTLTLMALIAIVQVDIKKCLAYSTLSQLGYMIFGLGCGAWIAALFHLITHAFFKAMLFLGSGQVIEGCHHEQDMRKMGGLRKKMPVTCWTFLIGVLAISGAGIAGTHLGLGGFFSKDEILAVAYVRSYEWDDVTKLEAHDGSEHAIRNNESRVRLVSDTDVHDGHQETATHHADIASIFQHTPPLPKWMFWAAIFTAYVTPFYMMRCWWMTFMGKPRDKHVYEHAHETPLMYVPLVVLAVGTLVASYYIFRPLIAGAAIEATDAAMVLATNGEVHTAAIKAAHHWLTYGVGGAFIVGFAAAIAIYGRGLATATAIKKVLAPIHLVLEKKYFIDELYDFVWVKGCVLVAHIARFIDTYIVDMVFNLAAAATERFAAFCGLILDNHGIDGVVNGIAASSRDVGDLMRRPQTGR